MIVDVPKLLEHLGIDAKRQGNELWAKCPYPGHENDTQPSWSIAFRGERTGLNNCFGCGKSGNAVELAMEVIGLSSYGAALDWMKDEGLIEDGPKLGSIGVTLKLKPRFDELEIPKGLLHDPNKWPSPAMKYAASRGLNSSQLYRWKIACAVDGELAGRLWIPTYDIHNQLLDWTARTWCDDDLKHRCIDGGGLPGAIFGERYWPELSTRKESTLVVCEGAFDAMACERAGARYVCAFNGSKTKIDGWKIMKLAGWGKLILAVDPDATGQKTKDLIVSMLTRVQRVGKIKVLELPEGLDCDDVWKRNPDELVRLLHEHE